MTGRIWVAAILAICGIGNVGAQTAEVNFERIRPNIEFVNFDGIGNPHKDGDSACLALQNARNAAPGITDYRNAKFLNKPNYGEGCEVDIYDRQTGVHNGRHHYQNWAFSRRVCPNGYSGVHYTDFNNSNPHCLRSYVVVKPSTCPSCVVGNPVDVMSTDKTLPVSDFESIDGLGFVRHYRSARRSTYGYPSALGNGWYAEHTQSLNINDASGGMFAPIIQIVMPNGDPLMFLKDATSGLWVAEKDQLNNALSEVVLANGQPGYRLSLKDNEVEWFSRDGRLLSIERSDGTSLTYAYGEFGLLQTVTNHKGRFLTFRYRADRRIDRVEDSAGRFVSYSYDSQGLLQIADYGDHQERYVYQSAGNNNSLLTRVEDGQGNLITAYTYGDERPYTTERAGGQNKYIIDSGTNYWTKIVVTEPNGAVSHHHFRFVLGRRVLDKIEQVCTDCVPVNKTYAYDTNLNPIEEVVGSSKTCRNYDPARNLELRRVEGASASFDCATMTGGSFVRSTVTQWHPTLRKPVQREVSDATGNPVARYNWTYNERGQVLLSSQTDPSRPAGDPLATRATTSSYCTQADVANGICPLPALLRSIDGARTDIADTTSYNYYTSEGATCASSPSTCTHRKGDLWKVTNALGQVVREHLRYDGAGRLLSSKDINGVVTDLEYSPHGWLTATKVRGTNAATETDDAITTYEYDPVGQVKKVIQPDGAFVRYEYDAARRLVDIFDSAGNQIHYTLDGAGNRTKEDTKDANGALKRTLSRIYNQIGQLKTSKTAEGHPTGYAYDNAGNGDTVTDALGRITDSDYDPLNRLAKTLQDVGGINAKTEFKYDALDRLVTVKDPKNLDTGYGYNGFGDQVRLTSPDTGESTFTYDSAGNRKTETDARLITRTYSYDALNRITGIVYPTTSLNVAYTYDAVPTVCAADEVFAKGRLSLMTDASGSTQYCYDRFGRTTRKVQATNGKVFVVRYAYTLAGQLSGIIYPDGAVATYQRDAQGRITRIDTQRAAPGAASETLLSQTTYHPFGAVAGWVYGNGRTMSRSVDLDYRPTAVNDPAAGGLSFGLGYDAVGNINKLTPASATNALLAYDYDALNRLTHLRDGPTQVAIDSYTYDATGNRLSFANSAGTQVYTYPANSHRLAQVGSSNSRSYDASGNSLQIGDKAFTYNDAGRSAEVKLGATSVQSYAYNGRGQQVRKSNAGSDRHVVYDESGRWLGEYGNDGKAIQQVVWMNAVPVGLLVGADVSQALYYLEVDQLTAPRVVIDPRRDVAVWNWDLKGEAFGSSSPDQDPDQDGSAFLFDMRFPGQRYDAYSGLNYNYFRNYDSIVGRYSQSDPIGLKGGLGTYVYANSAPLSVWDFYGLSPTLGEGYVTGEDVLGWVACNRGRLVPIYDDSNIGWAYGECPGPIRDCVVVHEQSHIDTARGVSKSICTENFWEPNYWNVRYLGDDDLAQRMSSEFSAHAAQLRCLAAKLRQLDQCDEKCRRVILRAIRDTARNIPSIAAGTYGKN
ncbi:RHS repeat-associated core domain-containing protein [Pseudomonas sp. CGJS7]|uniref:RHS repeat-associated core domain-containing protein n=1 Tax=Pseudomonas sp. CGJS7 TaxID=3109348 RepID=UPI003008FE76